MAKKNKSKSNLRIGVLGIVIILFLGAVIAAIGWIGDDLGYYGFEDTLYVHNLSANVSSPESGMLFNIDTINTNITWNGIIVNYSSISSWVYISDSVLGAFLINATTDNQTGHFRIPFKVTGSSSGAVTYLNFTINATNDAPVFRSIKSQYNFTENVLSYYTIGAYDEEEHYPLYFSINFSENCNKSSWNTRTNCSLFEFVVLNDTYVAINFTPTRNDVGTYYANISVRDFGENYSCSSGFCDNSTYKQNKTAYYSSLIEFNVYSSLSINATNCTNLILQENSSFQCYINISTKYNSDNLIAWSNASLRNYVGSVYNKSWFYSSNNLVSYNNSASIVINYTPSKTEVGNWSINFSVVDLTSGEQSAIPIYVYVNRTINSNVSIDSFLYSETVIGDVVNKNETFYVNASDLDLVIPDKFVYNETLLFASNVSWINLLGYSVYENVSTARFYLNYDLMPSGNTSVKINVSDLSGNFDERVFSLYKGNNTVPVWNQTSYYFIYNEDESIYLNISAFVNDSENDFINYAYSNDTSFSSFKLNLTTGIINFSPRDIDVGQHLVTITAIDSSKLNSSALFNFTIYNVADPPYIVGLSVVNATKDANFNINATADNYTTIYLYVHDEDFKIPSSQKSFYNENLLVNQSIEGNDTLFSFTAISGWPSTSFPNETRYQAVFIPRNSNAGRYNVTLNVSDASNSSFALVFNLTIFSVSHNPIISNIENKSFSIGINNSFYYQIEAIDEEDGNSSLAGNFNFTFAYAFLQGVSFLNSTNFNSTTGIINVSFNSTQGGIYHINISVNDSLSNPAVSRSFYVYVYDYPNITFPSPGYNFSLVENASENLVFRANHSVSNNLSFYLYLNGIYRSNLSYYGNNTNLTWIFAPNFTDESYSNFVNVTLEVFNPFYPDLNLSRSWNANITHTNAPISFSGTIPNMQKDYSQTAVINLLSYFSDVDASDNYYNQSISYNVSSNKSSSLIAYSVSNNILTLSASTSTIEMLNITASDLDENNISITNVSSNNFVVEFTTPSSTPVATPSSGVGGGGSSSIHPLKIIVPGQAQVFPREKIVVPIALINEGAVTLSGIHLSSEVSRNGTIYPEISTSFSKDYLSSLSAGQKEDLILEARVNTEEVGSYQIKVIAQVDSPKFSDWGVVFLKVVEVNRSHVLEKIIFTEELIASNPQCLEIKEILDEARSYYSNGNLAMAFEVTNKAIESCKEVISQSSAISAPALKSNLERTLSIAFIFMTLSVFVFIYFYFAYQRIRLKKARLKNSY